MSAEYKALSPAEIEKLSFDMIEAELPHSADPRYSHIIKRVIHTTADFDYLDNLCFSENVEKLAASALHEGVPIVTDTRMAKAGISKAALSKLDSEVLCFMSDEDVALAAEQSGTTRAACAISKAAAMQRRFIFAIGNAPTALLRLHELISQGKMVKPALIIGAPVGFVNVVQSKELIMQLDVPYIVARGRKGGSNVAAAICNALIYDAVGRKLE